MVQKNRVLFGRLDVVVINDVDIKDRLGKYHFKIGVVDSMFDGLKTLISGRTATSSKVYAWLNRVVGVVTFHHHQAKIS